VTQEDIDWECAWHSDDWGELVRTRFETESDLRGEFTLQLRAPEPCLGAVLSAAHPGYSAGVLVLKDDRSTWPAPLEIALEPARSMTILVLDSAGRPSAAAEVEQFGTTRAGAEQGLNVNRANRLLRRFHTTSADGTVEVGPFPGTQVFVARRGEEASVPWSGTWQERVTLRLVPTFEVGGEVSMPSWEHLNYVGERRITIAAQSRNLWRTLHTIRSVENGPWGPVRLPLVAAERYRVRLEGSPIIPVERLFEPPAAGARLRHDLVTEIGAYVLFRVADEEDRVIPTAVVRVEWQEPANPEHWNFLERSKNRFDQIDVWSLPPGSMKFTAFAPGYVPYVHDPIRTSFCEDLYFAITLPAAGRLRGKCLYRGEPVRDFEVVVSLSAAQNTSKSTTFFDREDGTFELDSVPNGSFTISASSFFTPACEPVAMHCAPGEIVEVTLELLDGIPGRGRVVDLATGMPLEDASIQMFVKGGIGPIARWGLPLPVRSDGSFEFRGFLPGKNFARALAPGYSNLVVVRDSGAESILEWGDIALTPAQDFTIELVPPERAEGALVLAKGATTLPGRTFSDGSVVYRGVSAGTYGVTISEADETDTFVEMRLTPGSDWTLRVPVAGPNHLSVGVVSEAGNAMAQVSRLEASYESSQGFRTIRSKFTDARDVVEFEGIDAPFVTVQAFDANERATTAAGSFRDGILHLELRLGGRPFLLRVVDADGEPVSDVRVILSDPGAPGMTFFGSTDASGECSIHGVPTRDIVADLQHARGSHFGIPVDASSRSVELILDPRAKLELRFLDGELPLAGVICDVVDPSGAPFGPGRSTSDDQGRATIASLGADTYRVRATRADCWPVDFEAEARVEGGPRTIQMRRLGELEIQVFASSGLPVPDLPVELVSLELETDVAAWIAAGRVRGEGLITDPRGRIRLERLPRGSYRWRIVRPSTEPLEGSLRVEPEEQAPVRISLP
jgi:hypothetical protein